MTSNQLHRRCLILHEAVDIVLGSSKSEEKDIAIFPIAQGDAYATDVEEDDVDECHKNDLLSYDVVGTSEVYNNDEHEVASEVSAVQSKEKTVAKEKEKKCGSRAVEEEQPEGNTRSKCYALSWRPSSSFPAWVSCTFLINI